MQFLMVTRNVKAAQKSVKSETAYLIYSDMISSYKEKRIRSISSV
jgi:hypothetical protein